MKNNINIKLFALATSLVLITGCSNSKNTNENNQTEVKTVESVEEIKSEEKSEKQTSVESSEKVEKETSASTTVEIEDAHGIVEVPVNPEKVVALDNRTFQTLADWDIKLVAGAVSLMPNSNPYKQDDSIVDIGNHREPNLEAIAAADPDLVIVGQRFSQYYEDIKALVPNAAVIDLVVDVDENAENPGKNFVEGFKKITSQLGQIFDKTEEADKLNKEFDKSIEAAKSAYDGNSTVMSIVVSGGEIGYSAPHSGRVWGPLYDIFGWKPSLKVEASSSNHKGDDISVEAIAESNPDWILVLDRDASMSDQEGSIAAKDVIENSQALANTSAVKEGKIIYAPNETYTNESIQTFITIFNDIAKALGK